MPMGDNKPRLFVTDILILIILAVIFLIPLFSPGFIITDDGNWMVIRLSAFFQSFREGQFPVRFLGRLNHGYGYPVANFLYPGFLYLGSLIHSVGFSFVDTVKIILGWSIVTAVVFCYLWLSRFFGRVASCIGSIGFLLSPYIAFDLYTRGSVGEILALSVVMVILFVIETRNVWVITPLIGFLIISHNTLALFFLPFLLGYAWVRKIFWQSLPWMSIGVFLASFFWVPAILESSYVLFPLIHVSQPSEYFLKGMQWLLYGLPLLASMIFVFRTSLRHKRTAIYFISIFCVVVFLSSWMSAFFWQWSILAQSIQFPYRLLAFFPMIGSWLIAYTIEQNQTIWKKLVVLYGVLGIISLYPYMTVIRHSYYPDTYYSTNEATTTVQNEYMPRWVQTIPFERSNVRLNFIDGGGEIVEKTMTTQRMHVDIETSSQSTLQINTIYYPGWGALLDKQPAIISYDNPQGVMRVSIPKGKHELLLEFRETIPRFIADCVSLVSMIVYVIFIFLHYKHRRQLYVHT